MLVSVNWRINCYVINVSDLGRVWQLIVSCGKKVSLREEFEERSCTFWGTIVQNSLMGVTSRKLTVTSRQNLFVYGRRTRSCIIDEKLLIRKERRKNKGRSGHWEQRWNPSPEGREKAPQCGRRRTKADAKLLVGSLVCGFVVLLFWRKRRSSRRSRRRTELLVILSWFV